MKKIFHLTVNYFNVLISKKNIVLISLMVIIVNILCLSGSGVIGFSKVDYIDRLPNVLNSYYNYYFNFCNLIVIFTAVLVNVFSCNKILNNHSGYMYLTGGIKRYHIIIGQICGIVVTNICVYMLVWGVNSICVGIFKLGNIDMGVFVNTMRGCANCTLVTIFALLVMIIFKSMSVSFSPVLAYVGYNLYFNNTVIKKGEETVIYKIINGIFPVYSIKKVAMSDVVYEIYTYKITNQLDVYFGLPYFVIYLLTLVFICVVVYDKVDL